MGFEGVMGVCGGGVARYASTFGVKPADSERAKRNHLVTTLLEPLFFLTLSCLFCHEMDAIYRHEWRIFAFLQRFDDQTAYQIFTAAHLPLFFVLLWFIADPTNGFVIVVDGFAIVHMGLHWYFRQHPSYEFAGFLSNLFIVGAGISAIAHLLLWLNALT